MIKILITIDRNCLSESDRPWYYKPWSIFMNYLTQLINNKEYARAESALHERLRKGESTGSLYISAGWLYDQWALEAEDATSRHKRRALAETYFKKALDMKEYKHAALRGLGTLCMHTGDFYAAGQYYWRAHSIQPCFDTYNDLGNLSQKRGVYDDAYAYYKSALDIADATEYKAIALSNLVRLASRAEWSEAYKRYAEQLQELARHSTFAQEIADSLL